MNTQSPILLVEDNQDDIDLTLRAFQKQGILNPITVIKNGAKALEYLHGTSQSKSEDLPPLPVLILLDVNLPKVHGFEVLRQVREHPRTKLLNVIVLTSSQEDEDILKSYKLGANSYIRKPVDLTEFISMIGGLGLYWLMINQPPPM